MADDLAEERSEKPDTATAGLSVIEILERERDAMKRERDELRQALRHSPKFVVLRGCAPGDLVFLTPGHELSMEQARAVGAACKELTKDTGIKVALLPHGFAVDAKKDGQDGGEQR